MYAVERDLTDALGVEIVEAAIQWSVAIDEERRAQDAWYAEDRPSDKDTLWRERCASEAIRKGHEAKLQQLAARYRKQTEVSE